MKIFVFLFCLVVAISALPTKVNDAVGVETDSLPIVEDQNEDLVVAEQRYRGGYRGDSRGSGRGRGRSYGGGGFLRTGHQEWHGGK